MRLKIAKYHFENGAINRMKQAFVKEDNIVPRFTPRKVCRQKFGKTKVKLIVIKRPVQEGLKF